MRSVGKWGFLAFSLAGAALAGEPTNHASLLNWRYDTYEAKHPVIEGAVAAGFHGRVAGLERIDASNAMKGDETNRTIRLKAWRNERVNAQVVVWTCEAYNQVRAEAPAAIRTEDASWFSFSSTEIPLRVDPVRYTMAREKLMGDIIDTATESVDMWAKSYRPYWVSLTVPADACVGVYRGGFDIVGAQLPSRPGARVHFDIELEVLDRTLPDPKEWKFFLDLWQHPWAIARYYDVKPFSKRHYELMEPIWRELASGGQKTITTTLTDRPWNCQNFDAYRTMVRHIRQADGSFVHDYSLFDEYVAFAKSCGLGPQIHCYSMSPWGDRVYYVDGATGDICYETLRAGEENFKQFWSAFLKDFAAHLRKKGWLGDVYIAMDERPPKIVKAVAEVVKGAAPEFKIAMAANHKASEFAGIDLHTFSVYIEFANRPEFVKEAKERHEKGMITTSYICCSPWAPNTFTTSPLEESTWMGYYTAAIGFDGLLRWAFCNWPRDPVFDSSFSTFPPGDTFLYYPNGRPSTRWACLRDGIEEFEKLRILRESGADMTAIDAALEKLLKEGSAKAKDHVAELRALVEAASAQ